MSRTTWTHLFPVQRDMTMSPVLHHHLFLLKDGAMVVCSRTLLLIHMLQSVLDTCATELSALD